MAWCRARRRAIGALRALGGGDAVRAVGRHLLAHTGEEEGFVDAALEDRDAHLHALLDDLTALESCFASELRGREVYRHGSVSPPVRIVTCPQARYRGRWTSSTSIAQRVVNNPRKAPPPGGIPSGHVPN